MLPCWRGLSSISPPASPPGPKALGGGTRLHVPPLLSQGSAARRGCANALARSGAIRVRARCGPASAMAAESAGVGWPRRRELVWHCHGNGENRRGEGRELGQARIAGEMAPALLIDAGAAPGAPAQGPSRWRPLPEPCDSPGGSERVLTEREALNTPRTRDKASACTGRHVKIYIQNLESRGCQVIINSHLQLSPISLTQLPTQSNCRMRFL